MNFTAAQPTLAAALAAAAATAASKTTLPVLQCVLLDASDGAVRIVASDLETTTTTTIAATVTEPGRALVNARDLAAAVRGMQGVSVRVHYDGTMIVANSGTARARFPVMNPADFPKVPTADGDPTITVSGEALARLIDATSRFVATDEGRPNLCGVFLEVAGDAISMTSTNGHSLAHDGADFASPTAHAIVPRKALASIRAMCDVGSVDLYVSTARVSVVAGAWRLTTRAIQNNFPKWRAVMPKARDTWLVVGRSELADRLKFVARFAPKTGAVRAESTGAALALSAADADKGECAESVDCSGSTGAACGFNAAYVLDVLASMVGETVEMSFDGPRAPIVFREKGGAGGVWVVMPMMN